MVKLLEARKVGLGCSATPASTHCLPSAAGSSIASALSERGANSQTFRPCPRAGFSLSKACNDFSARFPAWLVLSKKGAEAKPNSQEATLLTYPRDSRHYVHVRKKSLQIR